MKEFIAKSALITNSNITSFQVLKLAYRHTFFEIKKAYIVVYICVHSVISMGLIFASKDENRWCYQPVHMTIAYFTDQIRFLMMSGTVTNDVNT